MSEERSLELYELTASMPRGGKSVEIVPCPDYVGVSARAMAGVLRGIRMTRRKLERLSQLVRKSSLFEDATEEISRLIHSVKEELTFASNGLRQGARLAKRAANDTSQAARHCTAMEETAQIEIEETGRFFKAVIKRRSENMRKQDERKIKLGKAQHHIPTRHRPPVFDDTSKENEEASTKRLSAQKQLVPDQTYYSARASATADIEAQVQNIGNIFGKLTNLIQDQETQVLQIEEHAEETAYNVEQARNVLLERFKSMSSSTATALKVGGIIATTAVIYTVFLA